MVPLLPPLLDHDGRHARVSIVTGSYGAGHDAAARELARHLGDAGCAVTIHDVAELLPLRLGPLLRSTYYTQLRRRPDSWDATLRRLEPGRSMHRLATTGLRIGAGPVARAVAGADLVLTTHPFGAQALGHARRRGWLEAPAVTYLTDASVHSLWVSRHVDLHLAIHDVAADQARAYGGRAVTIRPLVSPPAGPGADPLAALEIIGPRALVVGGSLGIGELEQAAHDILATGAMTPVVVCGTNTTLRRRLDAVPGVVALGWRADLAALLTTSDCVVQNAGGFTSLEALASGTPVITYRPIPGHGTANADSLDRAGLVPWVRTSEDLRAALTSALREPRVDRLPAGAPTVLDALTAVDAPDGTLEAA
ncbi:MGDG synthase family glycosyltransferase [Nocardioides aquiterrae]|uniref:Galactosyldiacylglycerol synthase n=1 Tax=Nocardioides aquiterrae TaxID=203799 RepID=A0ABP4F373_9ACTN